MLLLVYDEYSSSSNRCLSLMKYLLLIALIPLILIPAYANYTPTIFLMNQEPNVVLFENGVLHSIERYKVEIKRPDDTLFLGDQADIRTGAPSHVMGAGEYAAWIQITKIPRVGFETHQADISIIQNGYRDPDDPETTLKFPMSVHVSTETLTKETNGLNDQTITLGNTNHNAVNVIITDEHYQKIQDKYNLLLESDPNLVLLDENNPIIIDAVRSILENPENIQPIEEPELIPDVIWKSYLVTSVASNLRDTVVEESGKCSQANWEGSTNITRLQVRAGHDIDPRKVNGVESGQSSIHNIIDKCLFDFIQGKNVISMTSYGHQNDQLFKEIIWEARQ